MALQKLAADKTTAKDFDVPCVIASGESYAAKAICWSTPRVEFCYRCNNCNSGRGRTSMMTGF